MCLFDVSSHLGQVRKFYKPCCTIKSSVSFQKSFRWKPIKNNEKNDMEITQCLYDLLFDKIFANMNMYLNLLLT